MSPRVRMAMLGCGLAATLAAAGFVGGEERDSDAAPSNERMPAPNARPASVSLPSALDLEKLAQPRTAADFGDMFITHSWTPPAPPEKREPSAGPAPPPLPFAFFGRMKEGRETTVFLARNEEIFTVRAGDTIADTWRVDEVNETALVLTYLPLSARQTLDIGAIN